MNLQKGIFEAWKIRGAKLDERIEIVGGWSEREGKWTSERDRNEDLDVEL